MSRPTKAKILEQIVHWKTYPCLFSDKEQYLITHDDKGKNLNWNRLSFHQQRIKRMDNQHIIKSLYHTTQNGIPIVEPYNDNTDFIYASYSDRNKYKGKGYAIGFFTHDYKFLSAVWNKIELTTKRLMEYKTVFAPDISLYLDEEYQAQNKYNVFRSRVIAAYWQYCGLNVVPVATWGNVNSFSYCFEGLPEQSVIAVCGIGHNKNALCYHLWETAIKELIRQKHPTKILVYGGKQQYIKGVDIEMEYIEDLITKHFRK